MSKLKLSTDLYEITEFYIAEGYDPTEAEDLAWKSVQGGGLLISETKTVSTYRQGEDSVGLWSAGCLVSSSPEEHKKFMDTIRGELPPF